MILLLDIGNTRVKWALLSPDGIGPQRAEPYRTWNAATFREVVLLPAGQVDRVVVSNVGGDAPAAMVTQGVLQLWGRVPEFVVPASAAAGIRNGYLRPAQLGSDRWAAMIGAVRAATGPVCVVSVGTAMTIDAVDGTGLHRGGVIVPGIDLMISGLMSSTSDLASRSMEGAEGPGLFADNTLGAIHQGARHALAALVDRAVLKMTEGGNPPPAVLLTGGGAEGIAALLTGPSRILPDLVLRGLAVLAGDRS